MPNPTTPTPAQHKPDCPMHPNWTDEMLVRGMKSCTCNAPKPTPPAPIDAEVREARKRLERHYAIAHIPSGRGQQALRTILAALDKAQGVVELWENQKNTICLGPACPLHTTAEVALERLEDVNFKIAAQAERIRELEAEAGVRRELYRTQCEQLLTRAEAEVEHLLAVNDALRARVKKLRALLVESQSFLGGNWRERRDAALAECEEVRRGKRKTRCARLDPSWGICTCGTDKPTPPTPTEDEVREAREYLSRRISTTEKVMLPRRHFRHVQTILAALTARDERIGDLEMMLDRASGDAEERYSLALGTVKNELAVSREREKRLRDLLIESQESIGGDWRQRRDAALKEASK